MLNRRTFLTSAAAGTAALLVARPSLAATPPIYAEGGVAIDGTDPVAYFTEGAPVPGAEAFSFDWNGATWRFATAANRDQFVADPEAYAPQYGGYCAWAVSKGYTASTVPHAWKIHDGRLFLNYSRVIQFRWARDIPGNVALADANWPKVLEA